MSSSANCAKSTRNKHFTASSSSTPEDRKLDITKEEFARIREALDKEEFRKLFFDYVQEIQDPANRKIYEEEIKQFEKERGVEVTFIHSQPGFVIKSSIDGEHKCFVNVASSPEVAPPKHETALNPQTGTRGLSWSIPLAQAPPRDDMDAKGQRCKVYDVIFHPDALHLARRNGEFRKCLIDTALDAVEREFHVKLDHTNLKFPKLDYKGIAQPTVIRKLADNASAEQMEPHPLDHVSPAKPSPDSHKPKVLPPKMPGASIPAFATPKYVIKHSHSVDLAEYTDELDAKLNLTVPRALIVEIELPLLKSSAECQLNVTSKSVYLLSERVGAKYQLKVQLPYEVDDKAGSARFNADQRRLCITLPVLRSNSDQEREKHDLLRNYSREDSGVELHSNSASPIEEVETGEEEDKDEIDVHVEGGTDAAAGQMCAITPSHTTFLKDSIHYQFPTKFHCNMLDSVMSFVLQVRNVKPDSIHTQQRLDSVHLQFASLGAGYYPTYYAFFIQLPEEQSELSIEAAETEAWENNIVLNLNLNGRSEQLEYYHVGLHGGALEKYKVFSRFEMNTTSVNANKYGKEAAVADASKKLTAHQVKPANQRTVAKVARNDVDDDHNEAEDDEATSTEAELVRKKHNKKQRKRNKPRRSLSESACDELKAMELLQQPKRQPPKTADDSSPESNVLSSAVMKMPQRKHRSYSECHDNNGFSTSASKGILKRYSRYGPRPSISDSCSSIDDCNTTPSYSRSIDAGVNSFSQSFSGIPEDAELGLSESCKKTVRFNDHIMKQVFRHDSSILGQRKKNQKNRDCKIRAQQRRLSEGDSADYEDDSNHKPANEGQYLKKKNGGDEIGDGQKCSQHDSGLDLTTAVATGINETVKQKRYPGKKNKKQEQLFDSDTEFSGNAMIFDMDDDM